MVSLGNAKRYRLIDFDRTLFDTASFSDWLWLTLADLYGIDKNVEIERVMEFSVRSGDWYDYRFFDHIAAIPQLQSVSRDELILALHEKDRPSFLFEDARGALDQCDEIITFGNTEYQEFKLGFCPEVARLPITIIQESKARYIVEHFEGPLMLIDDKHLEDELPAWVFFVLINREQHEPIIVHRSNFVVVNALTELTQL